MSRLSLVALSTILATAACTSSPAPEPESALSVLVEQGLNAPESALYAPQLDAIFVSNLAGDPLDTSQDGEGFIARYDHAGNLVDAGWAIGLHAPKGMATDGATLWVADLDALVAIDIETHAQQRISGAALGVASLNDVAISDDGIVYTTDTFGNAIFRVAQPANAEPALELVVRDMALDFPNGITVVDGSLLVATVGVFPSESGPGSLGQLLQIDPASGAIEVFADQRGRFDGVEVAADGTVILSDFFDGRLWTLTGEDAPSVAAEGFVNTEAQPVGIADIGLDTQRRRVLIPSMFTHQLFAFELAP